MYHVKKFKQKKKKLKKLNFQNNHLNIIKYSRYISSGRFFNLEVII